MCVRVCVCECVCREPLESELHGRIRNPGVFLAFGESYMSLKRDKERPGIVGFRYCFRLKGEEQSPTPSSRLGAAREVTWLLARHRLKGEPFGSRKTSKRLCGPVDMGLQCSK